MCTAITYQTKDHYFGRNLDLEYHYNETVTITPRNYPFPFRKAKSLPSHYAIIGIAYVVKSPEGADYPLYYDATNEKGLSMAGLHFPGNAHYPECVSDDRLTEMQYDHISPFEFIPWILGQCDTVNDARLLLARMKLVSIPFNQKLPLSPLHWIISDRESSIVVESVKEGQMVYENPLGILTNNPPFPYQLFQLNHYMGLSTGQPENHFCKQLSLHAYSRGMGALGLPGDVSSGSRFVRGAFTKLNSLSGTSESEILSQFFHILSSVAQYRGCVRMEDGTYEITVYSSCCNTDKGIYYYTTYENRQITGVDMHKENLDASILTCYPLVKGQQIYMQNE